MPSQVVVRVRIGRIDSKNGLVGLAGQLDIAGGFEADAQIEMRVGIPGCGFHGLAVAFAGNLQIASLFRAVAFGDEFVGEDIGRLTGGRRCGRRRLVAAQDFQEFSEHR